MCSDYKWMAIIENIKLISLGGDGGKNEVFFFKWQE
jgi:hypothetical protein